MDLLEVNLRFFAKGPNYETKSTSNRQLILDDGVHNALSIQGVPSVLKDDEGIPLAADFCLTNNGMAKARIRSELVLQIG